MIIRGEYEKALVALPKCDLCKDHDAVVVDERGVKMCGTCFVIEAFTPEPGAGTSALTGEPCC